MTDIVKFGYDSLICDIPGFPGYQISTDGTVYNKKTGRELKNTIGNRGYYTVSLNSQRKFLHILLAKTFIKNLNNKLHVDHINRNKTDNSLNNLRFVNASENNTNKGLISTNTSGYTGVRYHFNGKNEYWRSIIEKDGKRFIKHFLYTDEGKERANQWYITKKQELHTYD